MARLQIEPSFILKSIDPDDVITRYNNREFFGLSAPIAIGIETNDSYAMKCWLVDYTLFKVGKFINYYTNKEYKDIEKIRCYWCRLPIESKKILGVPIEISFDKDNTVYKMIDYFDCFQCALSAIIENNKLNKRFRNPLMENSEVILRNLYAKIFPNKKLLPAPDFRLLVNNGGPLNAEEFFEGKDVIIKLSNVICLPAKYEFLMIKEGNMKKNE